MAESDEGGDPVCWLSRVCPECGAFVEDEPPAACPRCGAVVAGGGAR
ncbi:hypothetical protein [Saccharothrix algeriensis]|uniref:Rubrerythrin n=1 Tax=Saccharothrix algeriensis TaxID=173560 RepID=A0A8T8I0I0_9PSEU|nr:hypothetical protein [Saccharothrix algeriensis]MBM7809897.1 rubrerythrin [Saccharothrix algeriensis]QTR04149.1 hypothetical protein J7S33_04030 [Saccharothrix algeriensis]